MSLSMSRMPKLSTAEIIGTDQRDFPPVQLRIPLRQVQEAKNALHKAMQTIHECIAVLDHPDAVGGEKVALGVVRYRIKLVNQEIARVKRVRV